VSEAKTRAESIGRAMLDLDSKLDQVANVRADIEKMGVSVPGCVILRTTWSSAQKWWEYNGERIVEKWEKAELRRAALDKLTEKDKEVLGL
jgi:hypothetical protein